jgi:hypothetical protein
MHEMLISLDAEEDCTTNPSGNGYRGSLNVSFAGHSCINWTETVATLVNIDHIRHNYCRRLVDSAWNTTSCFTTSDGSHQIEEKCSVKFCGKVHLIIIVHFKGTSFQKI